MTRLPPPRLVLAGPAPRPSSGQSPVIEREPAPDTTTSFEKGRVDWQAAFQQRFRDDPLAAVTELVRDVLVRPERAEEAAGLLLPYLVRSSYAQRNLVFNALMDLATPQDLLFAALSAAARSRDPRLLQTAAELLEHYGEDAYPVLRRLARSGRLECRYFVSTIFHMEAAGPRRDALLALTEHPDSLTRQELLEETDRASPADAAFVCRRLASDPDERIQEAAREKLAYLES